jgi:hypothetical protein
LPRSGPRPRRRFESSPGTRAAPAVVRLGERRLDRPRTRACADPMASSIRLLTARLRRANRLDAFLACSPMCSVLVVVGLRADRRQASPAARGG